MTHQDGNKERCLVLHYDVYGNILPQCIRCSKCYNFIRPEDMSKDCPADKIVLDEPQNIVNCE
jgi:hypothetical protein